MKQRRVVTKWVAVACMIVAARLQAGYIGLSSGAVEVFDASGNVTATYTLGYSGYTGVAYGDFITSNEGDEVATFRGNSIIEYFDLDLLTNGAVLNATTRLTYNRINEDGGRTSVNIASISTNGTILTVANDNSDPYDTASAGYTYTAVNSAAVLPRDTYHTMDGAHLPYISLDAGAAFSTDDRTYSAVAISEDNYIESYKWNGYANNYGLTRTGYRNIEGYGTVGKDALVLDNDQIVLLGTNNVLQFLDYNNQGVVQTAIGGTASSTLTLNSAYDLLGIAYMADPLPPPEIGLISLALQGGTNAVLGWNSAAGFDYAVQYKTDLATNWQDSVTGVPGTGGDVSVTTAVTQAQSFYRVVMEE